NREGPAALVHNDRLDAAAAYVDGQRSDLSAFCAALAPLDRSFGYVFVVHAAASSAWHGWEFILAFGMRRQRHLLQYLPGLDVIDLAAVSQSLNAIRAHFIGFASPLYRLQPAAAEWSVSNTAAESLEYRSRRVSIHVGEDSLYG